MTAGVNVLNGGIGVDTMIGGAGNDIYYVDHALDKVIEKAAEGHDTIRSTVGINIKNNAYVEDIELIGTGNTYAVGNALNNVLTGNSGNNVLNGGIGVDTMIGGAGNDIYYVDHALDKVIEKAGEGHDTIKSTVGINITHNAYVEDIELIGTGNTYAVGNALNNVLTGNSGNNVLSGRGGADILIGGEGKDIFVYGSIMDSQIEVSLMDVIQDFTRGEDLIKLSDIDANVNQLGNQAFHEMISADQSFSSAGQLKFANNILYGEVNGDGLADFAIRVDNVQQLQLDDFIL